MTRIDAKAQQMAKRNGRCVLPVFHLASIHTLIEQPMTPVSRLRLMSEVLKVEGSWLALTAREGIKVR